MYQARWHIEPFFKYLKQNLSIKKLYFQSEKGAINQVVLTLITTLLTYLMFEPAENWLARHLLNDWFDKKVDVAFVFILIK